MNNERIQGRALTTADPETIRHFIAHNPDWHRRRLSKKLCTLWLGFDICTYFLDKKRLPILMTVFPRTENGKRDQRKGLKYQIASY